MTSEQRPQVLKGRRVLLVEDDQWISKLYRKWLELVGAEVTIANDGALGIAALKERTADIILLDLGMPGLNGFDTLMVLRGNEATKHIPIIVLSNTTMSENRAGFEEIKKAGVTDILRKYEVSLKEIIACVSKYFPETEHQPHVHLTTNI